MTNHSQTNDVRYIIGLTKQTVVFSLMSFANENGGGGETLSKTTLDISSPWK